MNCCINCFSDIELMGFVYSNSKEKGTCDFCKDQNTSLINALELQEQFVYLLDIYQIDSDNGLEIVSALQNDWNIFNIKNKEKTKKLLESIIIDSGEKYLELLNSKISISVPTETNELIKSWYSFKEEIKHKNRFFIESPANFESIEEILPVKNYIRDTIFYRSRVSNDENGYLIKDMGKPPKKLVRAGRANPQGISYLYVAQSIDTTLYEARATFLDYVSICKFKLLDEVKVITLRTSFQVSPFTEDLSIEKYIKYKPYIDLLEKELSKPLRKQDNELDYLPTEYLCEYIKHLGYDGVEYGSSLHEEGVNLVFFNDNKLKCMETDVYEISKIDIKHRKL